jgi:hypothetical protein
VTPISLGIFASANQSAAATSFESIATVTVGSGGTTSVDFTSIPGTYTHLQIRAIARSSTAGDQDGVAIRFNSDTASNYNYHYMYGIGESTPFSNAATNTTQGFVMYIAGDTASANIFGAGVFDILDYANTNKYKTVRSLTGEDRNGAGDMWTFSSLWRSTSAITSISLYSINGGGRKMMQYSSFALYGIKAAA